MWTPIPRALQGQYHYFSEGVSVLLTCEPFDVREEYGDLLVAVNVDLVELVGLEVAVGALLLLRYVADHLLRDERRQHCGGYSRVSFILLLHFCFEL